MSQVCMAPIVKAGQKETGTSCKRKCMLSVGKHTNSEGESGNVMG